MLVQPRARIGELEQEQLRARSISERIAAAGGTSGAIRVTLTDSGTLTNSGTLTTAGGLLFFGDDSESFEAVEASNGRVLWHFNTGQTIHASPMTYSVDAVQYVVVSAGSDVFSFSLPH